jgi:hypothetical protein
VLPWLLEGLAVLTSAQERLTLTTLAETFHSEGPRESARGTEAGASRLSQDQVTCAHVLRLTAAQADTSLMPNSTASCR